MRLVPTPDRHFDELMTWFPDRARCQGWGGPDFRYPFTPETFREDCRRNEPESRSLLDDDGALLGFGQYYPRAGRCHLARLAIAPERRGQHLGARLIAELAEDGCPRLGLRECGLFVMRDNPRAVRLYARVGFVETPYVEAGFDLPGSVYMTADRRTLAKEIRG